MEVQDSKNRARAPGSYLVELVVIFVGVALAFAVENLREDLNERSVGDQYLADFRQDLLADAVMLNEQLAIRQGQLDRALTVIEFYEGRPVDPQAFFEAYYPILWSYVIAPNRNTMDEVLNSGSLRLIRDAEVRTGLLNLYTTYGRITHLEEHVARDFDNYLYDPTFSSVRIEFEGPWDDTPEYRRDMDLLLGNLTVENGIRLVALNIANEDGGLLQELRLAQSQVEALLASIPED
jgi:hypothetical protein